MFIPTEEQKAIAEAVRTASANIGVNAGAGTGKSTSARYVITDCIPPHKSVLYCAFNRITAKEFEEKVKAENPNAKIYSKTFNGLGYSAMLKALGCKTASEVAIRDDKYDRLAQDWAWANITQDGRTDEHRDEAARMLAKLVAMFMCNVTYGISGERDLGLYLGNDIETDEPILVPYDPMDRDALKALVYKYDLFGLENVEDEDRVIGAVAGLLEQGYQMMLDKAQRTVSFMEQVFWTVVKDWRVWQYDWVLVDECLPYRTAIHLADGSHLDIGEIVEGKREVDVLGYDIATGKQRPCRVIGWHKILNQKPLVKITVQSGKKRSIGKTKSTNFVVCTADHKIWADGQWIEAGKLAPGMKAQIETAAFKSQAYKITDAGRSVLSTEMTKKNATLPRPPAKSKIRQRGGNGKGPTLAQQTLAAALGPDWVVEHATPTGIPRGSGYPTCYKVDIANPRFKIAVEVDGTSHQTPGRREQDTKKDWLLNDLGWTVLRFTNRQAIQQTAACKREVESFLDCPMEAVVIAIEPVTIGDNYVYDITVEGCHNFYANGILVHNCQDLSPIDRALVDKHLRPGSGRLLMIGDPQQAVYAFRGADNNGFDNSLRFWAVNEALPLSISRRCPKAIAALVQDHKPGYRSTDDAPEGAIAEVTEEQMIKMLRPDDAVISRVRGPMIPLWRKLTIANIPAIILGSDIGKSITSIIKQVSRRKDFVYREIHAKLKAHEIRKIENMVKRKKPESDIANYRDQMEAVYGAVDAVYERCTNIETLIREIEAIFKNPEGDSKNTVKIMTGHGAKGLEFNRVFNLTPDKFPLNFPNMSHAAYIQELNLRYVVQTRTRGEYYLVVEKKEPTPELSATLASVAADNQEQMTLFVQGILGV